MVETLQERYNVLYGMFVVKGSIVSLINDLVKENISVLIYFDNYGILESAIWLPRFSRPREKADRHTYTQPSVPCSSMLDLDPKRNPN